MQLGGAVATHVIRGIRNCAGLQITYRADGKPTVFVENTIVLRPAKPEGSNTTAMLNGGWPTRVCADGSTPGITSGILRRADKLLAFRMWSRPIADRLKRFSIEFADPFKEYKQDSLAVVDAAGVNRAGQEIAGCLMVSGVPTLDRAALVLKFFWDPSLQGNLMSSSRPA